MPGSYTALSLVAAMLELVIEARSGFGFDFDESIIR